MTDFQPGDKVIHRREKDARNVGTVMDIPASQQKPGWIAVYFQRKVWCKPENLRHLIAIDRPQKPTTGNISTYWTGKRAESEVQG